MTMIPVLDLETTGFDVRPGAILEVSLIVIDTSFRIHEEYTAAVHYAPEVLEPLLSPWAALNHLKSGLLAECYASKTSLAQIEADLINVLNDNFGSEKPVLAGSSIHFDRKFIEAYMPALDQRLHYRMMDISGLWEWARIFHGVEKPDFGPVAHRGLPDVMGSARLLKVFGERVHVKSDWNLSGRL